MYCFAGAPEANRRSLVAEAHLRQDALDVKQCILSCAQLFTSVLPGKTAAMPGNRWRSAWRSWHAADLALTALATVTGCLLQLVDETRKLALC